MIQNLIILLIFIAALAYLARMVYRSVHEKSCASGCGKCGVDFSKLEKQIQKKSLQ